MIPRYKFILFDGYGTLFNQAMDTLFDACQRIVNDLQLDMTREAFLDHWDRYFFPMIREGTFINFWDAHIIGLERVFSDLNIQANPKLYVDDLFNAFGSVPLYPDVKPTLQSLNGVQTGVVSNADHGHLQSALSTNGLTFPLVISSESARCYKPNPDIFHQALRALNAKPEDVLYVGDSQEDDIVGTKRAGIPVAWLNRDGAKRRDNIPEPDHEITSLSELLHLIAEAH